MNYKIIDVYVPMSYSSTGVSSSYAVGYYSDYLIAKQNGKGKSDWGGDCSIETRKAIIVENNIFLLDKNYEIDLDDLQAKKNEILKEQAKAKLSAEELNALGIKD